MKEKMRNAMFYAAFLLLLPLLYIVVLIDRWVFGETWNSSEDI